MLFSSAEYRAKAVFGFPAWGTSLQKDSFNPVFLIKMEGNS